MATGHGQIFKEINSLFKRLGPLTQGQARIETCGYDDITQDHRLILFISPNDGMYKGATVKFELRLGQQYPETSPEVYCLHRVYHPNIDLPDDDFDLGGSVCVNTLDEDWTPGVGLDGCIMSVLYLFYHPNLEDPLNPVFGDSMTDEEMRENVRRSLRGEEVEGYVFDCLVDVDEDLGLVRLFEVEGGGSVAQDGCDVEEDVKCESRELGDEGVKSNTCKCYDLFDNENLQDVKRGENIVRNIEFNELVKNRDTDYMKRFFTFVKGCFSGPGEKGKNYVV